MKTINYIIVNYIKYATLLILTYIILGYLLVNCAYSAQNKHLDRFRLNTLTASN